MKQIGVIYEETNYDVFHKLKDNRDVLASRVGKIKASISEKYILNPIIVNESMEIIDGQGRYEARKQLGLPIHYIVSPGANNDDCRRMNKYNTKWNALDFAKSYARAGKESYINLLLTCKITGYSITKVLRLANHGAQSGKGLNSAFENGTLTFSREDVLLVKGIKEEIDDIANALMFSARLNDAFMTGVKICMETEGYSHKRMIESCKHSRSSFAPMARLGDQLVEFERIYNKGFGAKNRLYFSDYMRNKGSNIRDYSASKTQYTDTDVSTLRRAKENE